MKRKRTQTDQAAKINPAVATTHVLSRNAKSAWTLGKDNLAVEAPMEIRIRGRSVAVTMRTPGHDNELAAGFLLTERIIRKSDELRRIAICRASLSPENTVDVFLAAGVEVDFSSLTRHVFASSSCGICGKASIKAVKQHFPPATSDLTVSAATLSSLPEQMQAAQRTFAQTGGLHAAAIFDADGKMIVLREDIGRHNAVDKVVGFGLLNGTLPFVAHILLVSGRASFEIMQKALAAQIPIVCAVSAPSSLAVEFAHESRQTLIGFLRGSSMNIYAGERRIVRGTAGKKIRVA